MSATLAATTSNDDCNLINLLWKSLLNNPDSNWYLGNIIRNGLSDPLIGVNIPPFPSISVGDIPTQTMFNQYPWGYIGISMSNSDLSGLGSYSGGSLVCTPISGTETTIDFTFNFNSVVYSGNYDVGTSGVVGCAIATGAAILGYNVGSSAALAATENNQQLDLAAWFRDNQQNGLQASDNGQLLVGTYYLHQDTIQTVTTASNNYAAQYRQLLAAQQSTSDAVYQSTNYYRQSTQGQTPEASPPPQIGSATQYAGGFNTYVKLQLATQQAAATAGFDLMSDDDNDYADLLNSMEHFNNQVLQFQQTDPGEVSTEQIMNYIPTAHPNPNPSINGSNAQIPIYDLETQQVRGYKPVRPLDVERIRTALAANTNSQVEAADATFNVKGSFQDNAQQLSLQITVSLTNQNGLIATVDSLSLSIGNLHITLGNSQGFPDNSLYNRVAEWIANTGSFQDTLKSKLNTAFNSDEFKNKVQDAINGGIKKLGF